MEHRAVMKARITIKEKPLGSLLVRVKPSGKINYKNPPIVVTI